MQSRRSFTAGLASAGAVIATPARAALPTRLRAYRLGSRSMLPTIEPQTIVPAIVGLVALDFVGRPSLTWDSSSPIIVARGDLVVFQLPRRPNLNWIFRAIGFPGDHIEVRDQVVWINGVAVGAEDIGPASSDPAYYADNPAPGYRAEADTARLVRETLPNGATYLTLRLHLRFNGDLNNMGERTVPDGRIFVLGDNRENANDSRLSEVGMLPLEAVLGKVVL